MPPKKLKLVVAALVLANQIGLAANAMVPPDSVEEIQAMLQSGQLDSLKAYLAANPELMGSDSPLSRALADFFEDSTGLLEQLSVEDNDALAELVDVAFEPGIY